MVIRIPAKERTITPTTPGRLMRSGSATGKVTEILGGALAEIGEQLRVSSLIAEKTRAQNQRDSALLDIQGRAVNELDLSAKKQKAYDDEVRQATRDASRMITIPAEKSLFELESELEANIVRAKIKGGFTTKIVQQGKIDHEIYLTTQEDKYFNTTNDETGIKEKQKIISDRDAKILDGFQAGYYDTKAEAFEQIKKLNKEWATRQLDHDISVDPALARENIVAGNYNLSAKEEKAALTLAKNLEARRKDEARLQAEEAMQQTEIDLYSGVVDGTKSLRDINKAEAKGRLGLSGGIREEVGADLRRLATKGNTATKEEKADAFIELQDRFTELNFKEELDPEELIKFRSDVVSAMASGKIRDTVGEGWIRDTSGALEKEDSGKAGWETIKFWVDSIFSPEKLMLQEKLGQLLLERTSKGEDDVKAANEIIEDEQKDMNPNRVRFEVGKSYATPMGLMEVVSYQNNGNPVFKRAK